MATTEEELLEQAMRLPKDARARLADRLVQSLGTTEFTDIERAWLEVAKRRLEEVLDGRVKPIPAEVALQQVRSVLRMRKSARASARRLGPPPVCE